MAVLIPGSMSERGEAEKLRLSVKNERCYNFAGESKFQDIPLLYSIAHCMVTNDSGPGHFSSVLDLPTFVLYEPETSKLYGSLGNSKAIYIFKILHNLGPNAFVGEYLEEDDVFHPAVYDVGLLNPIG